MCSFCVVPFTPRQGTQSGSQFQSSMKQSSYIERGFKEVTLLGQNVDSYYWVDDSLAERQAGRELLHLGNCLRRLL
jgi:tRNA-2-methylthio-N6-dimethylallyladenosine synthase